MEQQHFLEAEYTVVDDDFTPPGAAGQALVTKGAPSMIDAAVAAWLRDAGRRSARTERAYRDAITSFRSYLAGAGGLSLDGPRGLVRLAAQEWAGRPRPDGRPVANATYNQRLAILSAFYSFAIAGDLLPVTHPVTNMKRLSAHEYAKSEPLDEQDVRRRLRAIDRTSLIGRRDYALLHVALATGRRLAELRDMRLGDLEPHDDGQVRVVFPNAKGGKIMRDRLSTPVSRALTAYLKQLEEALPERTPDSPVWVSLSDRSYGGQLSRQSISEICLARLGVSKVHTLRHTYAHTMEQLGAPASLIQERLGHASLATTGRYLAALRSADNPYAGDLAAAFGAE